LLRVLPGVIAAVMLVEVGVLAVGPAARRGRFLPTVLAGLFIVLGWNAAVGGAGLWVVLAALAAGGAAHAVDVVRRW
jgi:hypothetical protein